MMHVEGSLEDVVRELYMMEKSFKFAGKCAMRTPNRTVAVKLKPRTFVM